LKYLTLLLILLATSAVAAEIQVDKTGAWTYSPIQPNTPAANFTSNAEGALILGARSDAQVNVLIYKQPGTPTAALGDKTDGWKDAIFKKTQASKFSMINQRTRRLSTGKWRYFAEYQSDTGTSTMLNSFLMAQELNGEIHIFLYEGHSKTYKENIAAVRTLLIDLDVTASVK
jgi:hypothetical protein